MTSASVQPTAEPFAANPDAPTAVLLCHGFTGSPCSMRPLAEQLAAQGLRVELPRLPGHGTRWQELGLTEWTDWYRAVEQQWYRLDADSEQVFVAGLSMGGALALRLAEQHPVAGVVLVNPALASDRPGMRALGLLKHLRPSIAAIGDDIARPGVSEHAYPRTPLAAAHSMTRLWQEVRRDLGRLEADVLLMTSRVDHVVDAASARELERALPPSRLRRVELPHSHHVATLDHDLPLVVSSTLDFLREHAGSPLRADADTPLPGHGTVRAR